MAGVDAFAQPWVQQELGLSAEQKDKLEAAAKEFAAAKRKNEALVEETLKKVLTPDQLRGLKMLQDEGASVGVVNRPWAQNWLRLSRQQKDQVKARAKEVGEAQQKEEALLRETMKKATAILAGDQRKKWEAIAGKPFKLQVRFVR